MSDRKEEPRPDALEGAAGAEPSQKRARIEISDETREDWPRGSDGRSGVDENETSELRRDLKNGYLVDLVGNQIDWPLSALHELIVHNAPVEEVMAELAAKPVITMPLHWAIKFGASDYLVMALLEQYPDAVKEKDDDGMLPLHLVAMHRGSIRVVRKLLEKYSGAAEASDKDGMMPLHWAIKNHASSVVVLALIEENTEATKKANYSEQKLPLHLAAQHGALSDVITELHNVNCKAIGKTAMGKKLPLHLAAEHAFENPTSEGVIDILLNNNSAATTERDEEGSLPIHLALRHRAPPNVVKMILGDYTDAAQEKDGTDSLPIHLALKYRATDQVVADLLNKYRGAAMEEDGSKKLPLHHAAGNQASKGIVDALLGKYRDAVTKRDGCGKLPLHYALENRALGEVVMSIFEKNPDAAKEKNEADGQGVLPLLLALRQNASDKVVLGLLEAYHDAAAEEDESGSLPLHYALENQAGEGVVLELLKKYPEAAERRGGKNGQGAMPLLLASKHQASAKVVRALVRQHPDAAKKKDVDGKLPLHYIIENQVDANQHENLVLALLDADMPIQLDNGSLIDDHGGSWAYCIASKKGSAVEAVRCILAPKENGSDFGGYGVHIRRLADVRCDGGQTSYELSAEEQRKEMNKYMLFCGRYELQHGAPEYRSATSVVIRAKDHNHKIDYRSIFDKADTNADGKLDIKEIEKAGIELDWHLLLNKNTDKISKDDFVAVCRQQLGDGPTPVVIKFMTDHAQWQREKDARSKYRLQGEYVVEEFTTGIPEACEIENAVVNKTGGLGSIVQQYLKGAKLGTNAIIMDAADRNLHQIFYQERPGINTIRALLQQVFDAVAHLHSTENKLMRGDIKQKLVHGDLKLLNVVRLQRDGKLRLIDFDAAVRIKTDGDGTNPTFAGAKFSSAILPPEMFFEITTEEQEQLLEKYWEGVPAELREKVLPKFDHSSKKSYVVKSFRTEEDKSKEEEKLVTEGLPYKNELVEASTKIDAWSLGVLAFTLLTGETLVPATRDDDCASGEAMRVLYEWGLGLDELLVHEKLEMIEDDAAYDLVSQLLQRQPSARPPISKLSKSHPFFQPPNADNKVSNKRSLKLAY